MYSFLQSPLPSFWRILNRKKLICGFSYLSRPFQHASSILWWKSSLLHGLWVIFFKTEWGRLTCKVWNSLEVHKIKTSEACGWNVSMPLRWMWNLSSGPGNLMLVALEGKERGCLLNSCFPWWQCVYCLLSEGKKHSSLLYVKERCNESQMPELQSGVDVKRHVESGDLPLFSLPQFYDPPSSLH